MCQYTPLCLLLLQQELGLQGIVGISSGGCLLRL